MECPVIYNYLDYRQYLNDLFNYRKEKDKFFSYRYFSHKAGFKSPNFLKLVINGQRNLSNGSIAKVAKGFALKKQEREFFENLVNMNQGTNHEDRNYYYQKMMSANAFTNIRKLEKKSYDYYSKWYYPVIRELITFGSQDLNPQQISEMLNPKITIKQAENAINHLIELNLIKKDDNGKWIQLDKAVTTGPEVQSLVIANYHREMIKLAKESIERYKSNERDITSLTLSINKDMMPEIKKKIQEFRKELLNMAINEKNANQVLQINFQAFPLTNDI